ncbi:hypothetical protein HYT17_03280 [Candidatus Microgenomates bacterium]|nr:hypothetical protein [Candidatus Microgenomates bacterium]
MKKERLILAFVAIAAGLIAASSIFYFYQNQRASSIFPQLPSPASPSATNGRSLLEISSPPDGLVTDSKTVEVAGKSQPKALIVINTNSSDYIITAQDDGSFAQKITLSDLENIIGITAYTENGSSETQELLIVYNTEEF